MKTRFTDHKSNIKYNKRLCEVSTHFADNLILHTLDKSSLITVCNNKLKLKNLRKLMYQRWELTSKALEINSRKDKSIGKII